MKKLIRQSKIAMLLSLLILAGCSSDDDPGPPAEASFTSSTQSITSGQTVSFTRTSENATELQWVFEGGSPASSTAERVTVRYETAGTYDVSITASNGSSTDTDTRSNFITVNDLPAESSFSASSQSISPGENVTFTNNSTNAVRYEWIFEGGSPASSTSENPVVTYNSQGSFSVTLNAYNSSNEVDSRTEEAFITVDDPEPEAGFSASARVIQPGQQVSFSNTSSNATRYEWSFEGGSPASSTAQNPTVTYSSVGTYSVTLKAFNGSDESDTETKSGFVRVLNPPTASFTQTSLTIEALESITFTNTSSGSGNSYQWTFNGGSPSSSTQTNPGSVTFNSEGTYSVSLRATNDVGTDTETKTVTVVTPTKFDLTMENNLFYDVTIYNNDAVLGTIAARSNRTFSNVPAFSSNRVDYAINAPVVGGKVVGINFRAGWNLDSPRGDIGLEVTNETASTKLQFIVIDNRENNDIYWTANPGTSDSYLSDGLFATRNVVTNIGYYRFLELNDQLVFHNNSNRNGTFWVIRYNENVVDDKSGRVDIRFDINGTWDSGTWAGGISRAQRTVEIVREQVADWGPKMQYADFSNSRLIKTKATER